MQVNNEQSNTHKMLMHNQSKQKVMSGGSLQRKLVDVAENNIDPKESTILNCKDLKSDTLKNLMSVSSANVVSDADAELIVKLQFIEKVDISQIFFYPASGSDSDSSPARLVKLFVNKPDLDFNDVETTPCVMELELPFETENPEAPFSVTLQGSKFTRLSSLQIFVEENFGTDATVVGRIKLEGFLAPSYH